MTFCGRQHQTCVNIGCAPVWRQQIQTIGWVITRWILVAIVVSVQSVSLSRTRTKKEKNNKKQVVP